jgi:hypothetical protein
MNAHNSIIHRPNKFINKQTINYDSLVQNLAPVSFRARLRAAAVGNPVRSRFVLQSIPPAPLSTDVYTYHTHARRGMQQPNPLVALVDTGNSAMYLPEQIFGALVCDFVPIRVYTNMT